LQGLKSTLGTLKDELFAEDDWDDDPWASPQTRYDRYDGRMSGGRRGIDPWDDDNFR